MIILFCICLYLVNAAPAETLTQGNLNIPHDVEDIAEMPEAALLADFTDETERGLFIQKLKTIKEARAQKKLMDARSEALGVGMHRTSTNRFTAFDCTDAKAVHKALDLNEPEVCQESRGTHRAPKNVTVQVLQIGSKLAVTGFQCSVKITKEVSRCGYDSIHYGSIVSVLDEVVHITPEQCRKAAAKRYFLYGNKVINVTMNVPSSAVWYSKGGLDSNHECTHVAQLESGGTIYTKSYETSILNSLIKPIRGWFDPSTGRIKFSNGILANYQDRVVLDDMHGLMVWDSSQVTCSQKISQIYKGEAALYLQHNSTVVGAPGDLITVSKPDENLFGGFVIKSPTRLCTRHAFTTHLSGILLVILGPDDEPIKAEYRPDYDVKDVHVQSNHGFLHIERSLELDKRFLTLQDEICRIERQSLFSKLHMIAESGSYSLLDLFGQGHMITKAGASAYLTVCVPKTVEITNFGNCTQEIPVLLNNRTLFVDPLTFTLQPYPTILPCDSITPVRWKIAGHWMCATPQLHRCEDPIQLSPAADDNRPEMHQFWAGMGGGIYSAHQQQQHQLFMSMWNTRSAVVADVTRNALRHADGVSGRLTSYYSDSDLLALKNEIGHALIPFFNIMGDYWSIVTGSLVVLALTKILLGMSIRFYITYRRRGAGLWLLTGLWDTAFMAAMLPWRLVEAAANLAIQDDDPPPSNRPSGPGGPATYIRSARHPSFDDNGGPDIQSPLARLKELQLPQLPSTSPSAPRGSLDPLPQLANRAMSEEPSTRKLSEWWDHRQKERARSNRYQELTKKLSEVAQSQQDLVMALKPMPGFTDESGANNSPEPPPKNSN